MITDTHLIAILRYEVAILTTHNQECNIKINILKDKIIELEKLIN